MRLRSFVFPVHLILAGFSPRGSPIFSILIGLVVISSFLAGLVFVGSYLDGTLHLPNGGKGLLNHYGVWAILIADPLVFISTAYSWYLFKSALAGLPFRDEKATEEIRRHVASCVKIITLSDNSGCVVYAMCVITGALSWLNNIRQTIDPEKYYGHQVFDAFQFALGFSATKIALFVSWVLIYPACGFVALLLPIFTFRILRTIETQSLLKPSVFHPDGCYGFAALGKLNISLLIPFVIAFFVALAILLTHEHIYASIVVPLVSITVIILFVSFITIYPILAQIRDVRNRQYTRLKDRGKDIAKLDFAESLSFGIERICFGLSNDTPYSRDAKMLLIAFRVIPIVITTYKAIYPFV